MSAASHRPACVALATAFCAVALTGCQSIIPFIRMPVEDPGVETYRYKLDRDIRVRETFNPATGRGFVFINSGKANAAMTRLALLDSRTPSKTRIFKRYRESDGTLIVFSPRADSTMRCMYLDHWADISVTCTRAGPDAR